MTALQYSRYVAWVKATLVSGLATTPLRKQRYRLRGKRNGEGKGGALSELTLDVYFSPMLPYDLGGKEEPYPHSRIHLLLSRHLPRYLPT